MFRKIISIMSIMMAAGASLYAGEGAKASGALTGVAAGGDMIGVGLSVGLACLGAGIALSNIGAAVVGAISEKPELLGRLLIILGLGEALAIYGVVIGILLWIKV